MYREKKIKEKKEKRKKRKKKEKGRLQEKKITLLLPIKLRMSTPDQNHTCLCKGPWE